MKIVFITPQGLQEEETLPKPLFSYSIATLVSLTPKHHQIELIDEIWGDLIDFDGDYDLVGITARTLNANRAYEIADEFMKRGKTVVLGGVHPSLNYEESIRHCSCVVVGEADNLWEPLLVDLENKNLETRYDAKDYPPVDNLPVIDYERIYHLSKREKVTSIKPIPIAFSRGCPYGCPFCCTPDMTDSRYRMYSAKEMIMQINDAKRAWFKKSIIGKKPWFIFCEENIAVNKPRTHEMLQSIKECKIKFSSFISMNLLTYDTVQHLVSAGCQIALVGFESLNHARQKETFEKTDVNKIDEFKKVIKRCQKSGLCVQGNFILDPLKDDYKYMQSVVEFVHETNIVMPIFSLLTPMPGNRMYKKYDAAGMIANKNWDKYTLQQLIVTCNENYKPLEYEYKYLEAFLAMYSYKTIFLRVLNNSNRIVTLFTSLGFRWGILDQIYSLLTNKWAYTVPDNVLKNTPSGRFVYNYTPVKKLKHEKAA